MDNKEIYIFTESYRRTEWDPSGDSEINLRYSSCNNLSMLANSIGELVEIINIPPDRLENFFQKLTVLEEEWCTIQTKFHSLLTEYENTKCLLENERSKTAVLNKRMKFIQDNQKTFEALKQTYLSMMQTESSGSLIEKEIQTENEIVGTELSIQGNMISLETLRQAYLSLKHIESFSSLVEKETQTDIELAANERRVTIKKAKESLEMFKEMINEKNEYWACRTEIVEELKIELNDLKIENEVLQSFLSTKDLDIKTMVVYEFELKANRRIENEVLKRILIKLHNKLRDYEETTTSEKELVFTDKEKLFIQRVMEISLQESLRKASPSFINNLIGKSSSAILKRLIKNKSSMFWREALKQISIDNMQKSEQEMTASEIRILTGKLRKICRSKSLFRKKHREDSAFKSKMLKVMGSFTNVFLKFNSLF